MQASMLFSVLDCPEELVVDVPLPPEHPIDTVSYCATTKIETHIHVNPQEIEALKEDHINDPYFTEILANLMEPEVRYKTFLKAPNNCILFDNPSG
jgi:hypothetical protein